MAVARDTSRQTRHTRKQDRVTVGGKQRTKMISSGVADALAEWWGGPVFGAHVDIGVVWIAFAILVIRWQQYPSDKVLTVVTSVIYPFPFWLGNALQKGI